MPRTNTWTRLIPHNTAEALPSSATAEGVEAPPPQQRTLSRLQGRSQVLPSAPRPRCRTTRASAGRRCPGPRCRCAGGPRAPRPGAPLSLSPLMWKLPAQTSSIRTVGLTDRATRSIAGSASCSRRCASPRRCSRSGLNEAPRPRSVGHSNDFVVVIVADGDHGTVKPVPFSNVARTASTVVAGSTTNEKVLMVPLPCHNASTCDPQEQLVLRPDLGKLSSQPTRPGALPTM